MHVGNCTDGSADYNLAGGGQVLQPPQFSGSETFRLAKDKQNLWSITDSMIVTFTVNGSEVAAIPDVSNTDLAILVQCGTQFLGLKLEEAPHREAGAGTESAQGY